MKQVEWSKMDNVQKNVFFAENVLEAPVRMELGVLYPDGKQRFGWSEDYTMSKINALRHHGIQAEPMYRKKAEEDYIGSLETAVDLAERFHITINPCLGRWKAANCNSTHYGHGGYFVGCTDAKDWVQADTLGEAVLMAILRYRGYELL